MDTRIEKIAIFLFFLVVIFVIGYKIVVRIEREGRRAPSVSVTIPEGFDLKQIADTISPKLKNFSATNFLALTKNKEGYLFPDTYFFLLSATEKDVINTMSENFDKKITPLLTEITESGKTEKDIIIMASIIEREAEGNTDRAVISGILWKRLAIGMPLQVDAVPESYKVKGLPKSPIANPGLEAIKAATHPLTSPYLYYLHDKSGNIHYAKTFAEHTANIKKYLSK